MSTSSADERLAAGRERVVVGLLADPEAAPAELARRLHHDLPELLAEHLGDETGWDVQVSYERLPPGKGDHVSMLDLGRERTRRYGWDLVVCVTDLPLRSGTRPIVADVSRAHRTGVASLPAFGVTRLRSRLRRVVVQIIAELLGRGADSDNHEQPHPPARRRRVNWLTGHFDRMTPEREDVDVRIVASRGRQRLLAGMIRDNRPWRVLLGLSGATAAALAFGAFYLVNSNMWELSQALGPVRLSVATLTSLTLLVTWLIVRHSLWESPRHGDLPHERDEIRMFNASTVITLTIGTACMFAGLFALILAAALLLLDTQVLESYVDGSTGLAVHANIAWLATSAAGIAGALGTSFDSERRVREAAYSYRERERRDQLAQERLVPDEAREDDELDARGEEESPAQDEGPGEEASS
ncbi:hypothetical protein CLV30_13337 [Haloactinopolyspora alba]|uniref:Uncharacterized protein n=1 Tax=Haloactinopolyspora alba TaxID=648780 RepID=A0A2P8D3W3_9ACTN|nr:hypothetical protein [Haloactinopolyspora alba]PSK91904.1 hypothetical protein CLV30_13337 [Haloactinopolyspora alba]